MCVLLLLSVSSCDKNRAGMWQGRIEEIYIITPTAWWLQIFADGSARYGYSAKRDHYGQAPASTFSMAAVEKELEPLLTDAGSVADDYAVLIRRSDTLEPRSRYTTSHDAIEPLFARSRKYRVSADPELDALWQSRPPVDRAAPHDPFRGGLKTR